MPPKPETYLDIENNLDEAYRNNFRTTMNTVKRTVEGQINERTPFNMTGFGICPENEQKDPNGNLPPKIRIDINGIEGGGASALSIGPRSRGEWSNITLDSMDIQWPGGVKPDFANTPPEHIPRRERVFNRQGHMSWKALHEILHLLGFHHTEYWDQEMATTDPDIKSIIQFGGSVDNQSIMNRGVETLDTRGLAVLSERDIACLTHVANKTITNYPDRLATSGVQRANPPRRTDPTVAPKRSLVEP